MAARNGRWIMAPLHTGTKASLHLLQMYRRLEIQLLPCQTLKQQPRYCAARPRCDPKVYTTAKLPARAHTYCPNILQRRKHKTEHPVAHAGSRCCPMCTSSTPCHSSNGLHHTHFKAPCNRCIQMPQTRYKNEA